MLLTLLHHSKCLLLNPIDAFDGYAQRANAIKWRWRTALLDVSENGAARVKNATTFFAENRGDDVRCVGVLRKWSIIMCDAIAHSAHHFFPLTRNGLVPDNDTTLVRTLSKLANK